uniref:OCEL domain-containing protein n=1 Tax=Esox lucius TaxID=8010 RepID=A0A6Q2XRD5_ESOLU
MANAHRTNVLVTSCLKTPVDPHTKAPLALYERERTIPYSSAAAHVDNRDYEKEVRSLATYYAGLSTSIEGKYHRGIDLFYFYFSNEEYYRKLEELKMTHLRTMAELEGMYRKKLEHKGTLTSDKVQGSQEHRWVVDLAW